MAYGAKEGDEQETMYRFLTPGGEVDHNRENSAAQEGNVIGRKLHRISAIYMHLVTANQPNEDPPLYKCLAPCLVITGFGIGSALVALFFYMGFAYGIDEGIMVGLFAFASWLYALVTYCKKTGFFRPLENAAGSPTVPTIVVHNGQDPPSYKEVTGSPPSYQEALKMIKAIETVKTKATPTTEDCRGKERDSVQTRL